MQSAYATQLKDIDIFKLFGAIAYTESKCGKFTRGDDGKSMGRYQMQIVTARGEGFQGTKRELEEGLTNFLYAYVYFKKQYDRFNSVELALVAYNAGPYVASNMKFPRVCRKTRKGESAGCYVNKVFKSMKDGTYCRGLF